MDKGDLDRYLSERNDGSHPDNFFDVGSLDDDDEGDKGIGQEEHAHPEGFDEDDEFSDDVIKQLREVRESGAVNMLDVEGVWSFCMMVDDYSELQEFISGLNGLPRSERSQRWIAALNRI